MVEPRVFAPGERVGRYRIDHELKRGATSIVYYAVGDFGDRVILKALRPERQNDPTAVEAFKREIAVLSEIRHDVREAGDVFFIAKYHKGKTLRDQLDETIAMHGRWADRESYDVFLQLADHLAGYEGKAVHCDLKPENIVLEAVSRRFSAHIVDYGASLLAADKRSKAEAGTPQYESPEQVDPQSAYAVSAASDLYALGVMMYEAQVGQPPFLAETKEEVRRLHVEGNINFDRLLESGCPPEVYEIIRGLLNDIPGRRPKARQVAAALEPFTRASQAVTITVGDIVPPEVDSRTHRRPHGSRRWPYAILISAVIAAAGIAGFRSIAKPAMVVNYSGAARSSLPTVTPPIANAIAPRPKTNVRPPKPLTRRQVDQQCSWFNGTPYRCIAGGYFSQGLDLAAVDELCDLIGKDECTPAVKEQLMRAIPEDGKPLRTWVSTYGLGQTVTCRDWAAFLEQLRPREGFDVEIEAIGDPPRLRYPRWQGHRIYDLYASGSCVAQDPKTLRFSVVPALANRAVDMVSWTGAETYCEEQHATLPTEAQLERVRRWNNAWPYVWGNAKPRCDLVAYDQADADSPFGECRQLPPLKKGARDVGSSPFDTVAGLGITDLSANVRHWLRDGFVPHLPPCEGGICVDPIMPPQPSGAFAMAGGSYTFPRYYMFAAFRGQYQGQSIEHGAGFLCVKTLPQSRRQP